MGGRGAGRGGGGAAAARNNPYSKYNSQVLLQEFAKLQKSKDASRLHGRVWTTLDDKQRKIAAALEARESNPGRGRFSAEMNKIARRF